MVIFDYMGSRLEILPWIVQFVEAVLVLAAAAPMLFLLGRGVNGVLDLRIDRDNALNCCFCGEPKHPDRGRARTRIRSFYVWAAVEYGCTTTALLILSVIVYAAAGFVFVGVYPTLAFLAFIPPIVACFVPLFLTRCFDRLDKRSMRFVCEYEPTCADCAADTPENRAIAEIANERWDAPATTTLEEVMLRNGLDL